MTYAELSEAQARRSRQFAEAQTNAMSVYCDAERDLKDLQAENVKLRKLVDGLTWCCEHHGCRQECPLYDVSEPDHCLEVSIKRELGVEVDDG